MPQRDEWLGELYVGFTRVLGYAPELLRDVPRHAGAKGRMDLLFEHEYGPSTVRGRGIRRRHTSPKLCVQSGAV